MNPPYPPNVPYPAAVPYPANGPYPPNGSYPANGPYPPNGPYPVYDPNYPPGNPYYQPYPYDYSGGRRTPETFDSALDSGTATSDSDSDDSYSNHDHHHHNDILPSGKLKIRRHTPGSNDPTAQALPPNLESTNEGASVGPVHVTIKRAPKQPDPVPIQPIPYPIPIIINGPVPRMLANQPMPFMPPVQFIPPAQIVQPVQPAGTLEPVQILKTTKPLEKPASPPKISSSPPLSHTSLDTESVSLPISKGRRSNISERKPIRTDMITPAPSQRQAPSRAVPGQHEVHHQGPNQNQVKEKVISYRTVPGLTTRELENNSIDDTAEQIYLTPTKSKVITYRKV